MKWTIIGCLCLFLLTFVVVAVHTVRIICLEENSDAILRAALRLEFTRDQLVVVGGNPRQLLLETNARKQLDSYMARHGWQPTEPIQMGATTYFTKGNRKMIVESRQISGRYRFYQLEKQP